MEFNFLKAFFGVKMLGVFSGELMSLVKINKFYESGKI